MNEKVILMENLECWFFNRKCIVPIPDKAVEWSLEEAEKWNNKGIVLKIPTPDSDECINCINAERLRLEYKVKFPEHVLAEEKSLE